MIMIYLDSSQSTSLNNVYFRSRRLNGTTSLPCYLPSLSLNWAPSPCTRGKGHHKIA